MTTSCTSSKATPTHATVIKGIMIMDWVHCNNCFLLPDREKCFFLTSCGHIFCRDCEEVCARNVCKLCGNQCTSIPLSSSMKPDVQVYFTDPDELLKAKLKEVQKIASFQRNHRARLMTYYRKELVKYRQMKEGFKKILKNLKDLESERKQLSKENDALKKLIEISGLSRSLSTPHSLVSAPGSLGSRKGISPHFSTPPTAQFNPVFSQFFNKLDSCGSTSAAAERVSVFSPPVNGRIGAIPGTPSPSTAMRALKLNSSHLSDQKHQKSDEKLYTPDCSQESSQECAFNLQPASNASSPLDVWNGPKNSRAYQCKSDPKRVVVHPYSPDE